MKTAETVLAKVSNIGYTSFYSYIEVSSVERHSLFIICYGFTLKVYW